MEVKAVEECVAEAVGIKKTDRKGPVSEGPPWRAVTSHREKNQGGKHSTKGLEHLSVHWRNSILSRAKFWNFHLDSCNLLKQNADQLWKELEGKWQMLTT